MPHSATPLRPQPQQSEAEAFFAETRHLPLTGALVTLLGMLNVISAVLMLAAQG